MKKSNSTNVGNIFRATLVVLLTLAGAYVLIQSAEIIITLLMAIIVASAIRPGVKALKKIRVPETVAIILIYFVMAICLVLIIFVVLPPLFNQLAIYIEQDWRLASRLIQAQQIVERYFSDFTKDDISLVSPEQITNAVSTSVDQFQSLLPRLLNNLGNIIAGAILIFVMGVYWLTSHLQAKRFILQLTSPRYRDEIRDIIIEIEETLGAYVRGVFIISAIVGTLNFIPMYIIGVPSALTLAFIIAICTMIPMVGSWIGGTLATLFTITSDPTLAIGVFIIFIVVSQIENYVLQPRILENQIGMSPLLVIVYTSIGFLLGGIVGALLAVPTMGALHIILDHLVIRPYREQIGDDPDEEIVVELDETLNPDINPA